MFKSLLISSLLVFAACEGVPVKGQLYNNDSVCVNSGEVCAYDEDGCPIGSSLTYSNHIADKSVGYTLTKENAAGALDEFLEVDSTDGSWRLVTGSNDLIACGIMSNYLNGNGSEQSSNGFGFSTSSAVVDVFEHSVTNIDIAKTRCEVAMIYCSGDDWNNWQECQFENMTNLFLNDFNSIFGFDAEDSEDYLDRGEFRVSIKCHTLSETNLSGTYNNFMN